jgi:hypothetical protein
VVFRFLATLMCPLAIVAAALVAQAPTTLIARRLPFGAPVVGIPLTPYSVQRAMAEVAWTARIPIGYEAPADEPWQPTPPDSTIRTEGETIEQLLDAIVAREPRYVWTIDDGVVHLRPRAAVANPDNILNQGVERFVVAGVTLQQALREVHFTLRPESRQGGIIGSGPTPSALGLSKFSVSVGRTTVQGLLDMIVKAHGASSWSVTYVANAGATRPYRISFHTFDGWGTTW